MLLGLQSGDRQTRVGGSTWRGGTIPQTEVLWPLVRCVDWGQGRAQFPRSSSCWSLLSSHGGQLLFSAYALAVRTALGGRPCYCPIPHMWEVKAKFVGMGWQWTPPLPSDTRPVCQHGFGGHGEEGLDLHHHPSPLSPESPVWAALWRLRSRQGSWWGVRKRPRPACHYLLPGSDSQVASHGPCQDLSASS